ncbi:SMC5-SMC6 complex localization factor protein 1 [Trichomycterus rosablanca]|uniref:SMC5-SMC6 complex localization factor protein 1 n=1 Tax=Trichomycterus rosablanca TaxID=2290929 RepID=UPI002F35F244
MAGNKHVFQMSGIKDQQQKGELLRAIRQLQGLYIGGSVYKEKMTHLIVAKPLPSEKFLSACAAGKWIVSPQYVLDSAKQNTWLPEASYELNLTANLHTSVIMNPLRDWREKVAQGITSGAFQGWVVYLQTDDPVRRDMFKRILNAGSAVVYTDKSATQAVTHVLTKDKFRMGQNLSSPSYNISYIAEHLFGLAFSALNSSVRWEKPIQEARLMQLEALESSIISIEDEPMDVTDNSLLSELEEKLQDYIKKNELRKKHQIKAPEIFSYYTPVFPVQVTAVDFTNVQSLVECGLFPQALEEIQVCLKPGVLPPHPLLNACMQHALHGEAEPYFFSMFSTVLNNILCNNPTWSSPTSIKYFLQILQCPQCKAGALPFFQTSVRYCLESKDTCHSLPSPAPPELLRFLGNLQAFMLRLFQLELHAAGLSRRTGGSWKSLIYTMFWNMWEKTTLTSRALQQLAELLVQTTLWALHSSQNWRLQVLATLQEILAVVVEFWAQEHAQLNSRQVEKGFQDLAEYIAIQCQDVHPDLVRELVPALQSHRLRMRTADAIYRNFCSRKGLIIISEPLSLHKIVFSYLKALGQLCGCKPVSAASQRADSQVSAAEQNMCMGGSGLMKDNLPKGFHKVNPAGETLLHRACKRNQFVIVLQILSLPGVDANAKDHVGWTPLHEACNHGSTECVRALLQHCPSLQLDSQVEGVSPLHDALLNQHTTISKMLLRHAGSALLHLRDRLGHTPLDLVSEELREELRRCAEEGDLAMAAGQVSEVRDLPFIESCSCLLSCLLLTYLLEQHIPSYESADPVLELSPDRAQALLRLNPETLTSQWTDTGAVVLAQDLVTLMSMKQYVEQLSPALTRCSGTHTSLLIQLLNDLQAEGAALLTGEPWC